MLVSAVCVDTIVCDLRFLIQIYIWFTIVVVIVVCLHYYFADIISPNIRLHRVQHMLWSVLMLAGLFLMVPIALISRCQRDSSSQVPRGMGLGCLCLDVNGP